jgi:hypothetical protein
MASGNTGELAVTYLVDVIECDVRSGLYGSVIRTFHG